MAASSKGRTADLHSANAGSSPAAVTKIETQPSLLPAQALVADPPWPYRDKLPGGGRGARKHYKLLGMSDIKRFPLPPLADDCRLFLWTTGPFIRDAYEVMEAWGFKDTGAQLIWHKLGRLGMGHTVRVQHEFVLIGVRGAPARLAKNVRSVFESRPGRHSEKPAEFYGLVETLSPGPYAELFARRTRLDWTCYGDEIEGINGQS